MKRFLFGIILLLAGCSKNPPAKVYEAPSVPVRTAAVEVRDVPLYFEEMGTITAYQTAEVKPQVKGLILAVHFTEGEVVEKDALLYTIDDAPYVIKVQEIEAQLTQNLANLGNARKKLERFKSLSKEDFIAKTEWDDLETKIVLYEAAVQGDEARLKSSKLDLQHCRVLAPIAGRSGKTLLRAGNRAEVDTSLVTLSQENAFYIDFAITEKELQQLSLTTPFLEIYAAGKEECLATGKVVFLDHTIDSSGMLFARGLITIMHKPLYTGQVVRTHLFFGKKDDARLIPLKAIKINESGPYVFSVKEDNTVEIRSVKLGPEEKGMIVVEEGLDDARKVVIDGQLRLFPGSKIEEI
jgi:multidrug efflux system membrane fusion protein